MKKRLNQKSPQPQIGNLWNFAYFVGDPKHIYVKKPKKQCEKFASQLPTQTC